MIKKFLLISLMLVILLMGCSSTDNATEGISDESVSEEDEIVTLKLGLLPVLDTLPIYIAQENGYFEEAGVNVEVIPVSSPVERDQLMQSGEIDGMLNELTSTAIFNRDGIEVQIVSVARAATDDGPVFRVLAAPDSGLELTADLAGVPIGVSLNSIIEYLTFRMLESEGLSSNEIVVESVPVIPERFQLLMSGQIQAATLPDPLAQAALEAGATLIIDDTAHPEYSMSVYTFNMETIEAHPEEISRFMSALDKAVADLNADPESYRALFLEKVPVPESVQETYEIPPFPRSMIPTEAQWADVQEWLLDKELLEETVSYNDSVTDKFLPAK